MPATEEEVMNAMRQINDALNNEVKRLLGEWDASWGEPALIYDMNHNFLGLGKPTEIGEQATVLLPARKIVLAIAP